MIENRIPITLTGCYKKAGIPIGKAYFCDRLRLIDLLEEYAEIQRKDMNNCSSELDPKEVESFVRRIYERNRCSQSNTFFLIINQICAYLAVIWLVCSFIL